MENAILLIGNKADPHIKRVVEFLQQWRVKYFVIDPAFSTAEGSTLISYYFQDKSLRICLKNEGVEMLGEQVTAVWWRLKPSFDRPASNLEVLSPISREFSIREWQHTLEALELLIANAFWINPRQVDRQVRYKPLQLLAAMRAGFDIPLTLISNEPNAVKEFVASVNNDAIYKPLTWFFEPPDKLLYTNRVTSDLIESNHRSIKVAPGIFQQHISKLYELRVTVVGNEIFCLRIESQKRLDTTLDWRRNQKEVSYEVEVLPKDIAQKLIKFHKSLGLVFGAYDFIVTDKHRYLFLEVNPVGQWLWLEDITGIPVSQAVAKTLIEQNVF